jgi:hypothetical protein
MIDFPQYSGSKGNDFFNIMLFCSLFFYYNFIRKFMLFASKLADGNSRGAQIGISEAHRWE